MCLVFTGKGVAWLNYMKPHKLLIVGALMLTLILVPAAASAQRRSGRHQGGGAVARPVVIVVQPVAVRPTIVQPVVVVPRAVVRQPIIGRSVPLGGFRRSSVGSIPVRTGFGTLPVRTGFGMTSVRTGFGVHTRLAPVPVTIGQGHAPRSKGVRALKPRHAASGVVVVAYPVPYPHAYPRQYGVTTSSAGYTSHRSNITVYGGGVSEGPSTYSADLAAGASSGVRFEVSPAVAGIYVDGTYVGTVQDFSAETAPLVVGPGSHRIDLLAPGYRTTTLEVTIAAGQIIRYEGELERLRPY
jgi:hypothetical protein